VDENSDGDSAERVTVEEVLNPDEVPSTSEQDSTGREDS
jgi:DNA gyrase subunit A